jgi:hypothetical protein
MRLKAPPKNEVIEIDTRKRWPRYDPSLGFCLCEHCWNRGPMGMKHNCLRGSCECPCAHMKPRKKEKFTGEGQMDIDMTNSTYIGPKS